MSLTKETNYTLSVVAMLTLSAQVCFCPTNKQISLFATSEVRQKGPPWNRHSSHVVVTPINRLCGVDNSWFKKRVEISVFIKTVPVTKLLSWQQHYYFVSFVGEIYGATLQEHCFNISRDIVFSVFTTFQLQWYDIITDLICITEKKSISPKRKKIFLKKSQFFCILKGLSNKRKIVSVIYTSSFFCLSVPKRDLDTKKTPPSFEVCPESRGAMLEYIYIWNVVC